MELGLVVRHDADGAVGVQVARELSELPALRLELLERPLEERVVVGLEPDLAAERQQLRIQREERAPGQAALFLPRLFPRVGKVDIDSGYLAGGVTINRVVAVKTEETKCDFSLGTSTGSEPV